MQKKDKKVTVTAHTLVKNEENFIWYAIMSVLPYVDKMIVFDTGSTDKTVPIIKKILKTEEGKKKIHFEEKGEVDKQGHTDLRNEMIKMTKTDWFMILDGDEVWDPSQIKNVIYELSYQPKEKILGLVHFHLASGDIYHYTELGHFSFPWGVHSQITVRLVKNVGGIGFVGEYLKEGYYIKNRKILEQQSFFASTSFYYHFSKLKRSKEDNLVWERFKPSNFNFLGPLKRLFLKNSLKLPDIMGS